MGSNVQNHTVQCVLMVNLFNEKVFLFLWFWYLILMCLTALSFIYWAVVLMTPFFARTYVVRHLKLANRPSFVKFVVFFVVFVFVKIILDSYAF